MTNPNTQELTEAQNQRNDVVYNSIYLLVNELVPEKYRTASSGDGKMPFDWDMNWIGNLADDIEALTAKLLQIPDAEREAFEMEFAPFFISPEFTFQEEFGVDYPVPIWLVEMLRSGICEDISDLHDDAPAFRFINQKDLSNILVMKINPLDASNRADLQKKRFDLFWEYDSESDASSAECRTDSETEAREVLKNYGWFTEESDQS